MLNNHLLYFWIHTANDFTWELNSNKVMPTALEYFNCALVENALTYCSSKNVMYLYFLVTTIVHLSTNIIWYNNSYLAIIISVELLHADSGMM